MLTGKKVVLGVTGSIAAYKTANLASMLVKQNCRVQAVMTEHAAQFISPVTFETLTSQPCLTDTFTRQAPVEIHHLTLGQTADLLLIAPATANILGKIAHGIADDLLTSTVIAATCPVLIAPAMNVHMYRNPIVQENISRLRSFGYEIIAPEVGRLACDAVGEGKLAREDVLMDAVLKRLSVQTTDEKKQDLAGLRILVTAGPTREAVDPVRFITNCSSGRMGYAVAECARRRGAHVTLVSGPVSLPHPKGVCFVPVLSAEDMYREVMGRRKEQDIVVKAAAVADYRPKNVNPQKTKKQDGTLLLELERTKDILAELGSVKEKGQCICGFSMETERLAEHSRAKLLNKHADLIAANSLTESGAGFGGDTNRLLFLTKDGEEDTGMRTKEACADLLLDRLYEIWKQKQGEKEEVK